MRINSLDVNQFPKNFLLAKLVEKRKNLTTTKPETIKSFISVPTPALSLSDRRHNSMTISVTSQDIEEEQQQAVPCRQSLARSKSQNLCQQHGKPFEIICIEDRCRICSNCALFGAHRNHEIKPEGEVLKEIASRAEHLIDIFQMIQKHEANIGDDEETNNLQDKLKTQHSELSSKIQSKFEEYINMIKAQERRLLDDLDYKFRNIREKVQKARQIPHDLQEMIQKWKHGADEILTVMTEKSEKGELTFELLADKYNARNDIIHIGDKLFNELKKAKETSLHNLTNESTKISLNFTQGFSKILETLCYIADGEDKENSFDPSTDITCRDSYGLSQHSSTPNKSEFKLLLNSELIGQYNSSSRNQSQMPSCQELYLRTNTSPESYRPPKSSHKTGGKENVSSNANVIAARNLSPAHREILHNKTYDEEDSNLLSFDLKDLGAQQHHEAHNLAQIVRTEPTARSYYMPQNNKIMNPYRTRKDLDLDEYENVDCSLHNRTSNSSTVIVKSPRNNIKQQQPPGSFSRLSEAYGNHNYSGFGGDSRAPSRSISPIRSDISQGATPKSRLRKRTGLNIADKFEGVVDGIKQNCIETADLTGADLGDQGVYQLVDYLKGNTRLKSLKLLKNKISDDGGLLLVDALYYNNTIQTLNLTQNLLTEKTVDAFLELFRTHRTLRTIYFNQNSISLRNIKNKVKEMTMLGVNVSI